MTDADVLLFLAIFLLGSAFGGALLTWLIGPDRDLSGPWDPRR